MRKLAIRFCAFILAASVGIVAHHAVRSESCQTVAVKPVLTIAINSSPSLENTTSIFTIYDCESSLSRTEWSFSNSNRFLFNSEKPVTQTCSRCGTADHEWLRSSGLNKIR